MGAGRGRVWGWAGHSLCGSVGHWPNLRLQFIMHCTPCGLDSSNSVSGQIQSTSGSSMSLEPRVFHESQPGRSFSPLLARSISIPPQGSASPLSMVGSSSKLTSWNFVTYELHDRVLQHRTFHGFPSNSRGARQEDCMGLPGRTARGYFPAAGFLSMLARSVARVQTVCVRPPTTDSPFHSPSWNARIPERKLLEAVQCLLSRVNLCFALSSLRGRGNSSLITTL
jgi:hypothetical protein